MLKINADLAAHTGFWIGYITAFWGAFEMAYQSPNDPIWSGTFGWPIPHHYIWGFVIVALFFVLATRAQYILLTKNIRRRLVE